MLAFDARVLVVEDNAVNQDVASGILKQMGCSVVTAANGRSAVQLFAQENFDLILMDCEMPVMDGFDATKRIRDIERAMSGLRDGDVARSHTPIVALTAHALAEVRERCLKAEMDDFLVKPYDEAQIADMLGRWLTPLPISTAADAKAPGEEEAPSAPVTPISLDKRIVEHIRRIASEDGSSLLGQVASQFAANAGPQTTNLRAAARNGDPEAVWRAAHSLRSSAGAVGAYRVAQCCAEIEVSARDNGILPAEAALAALDSELAAATRDLNELSEAEAAAPDRRGSGAT